MITFRTGWSNWDWLYAHCTLDLRHKWLVNAWLLLLLGSALQLVVVSQVPQSSQEQSDAPTDCPRTPRRGRQILCWWKINPAAVKPGSSIHQLRIPSISPSPPERICRKKPNKKNECSFPKHSSNCTHDYLFSFCMGYSPPYFFYFFIIFFYKLSLLQQRLCNINLRWDMEIFSISQQLAQNPGLLQPAWDCLSRHTSQESFAALRSWIAASHRLSQAGGGGAISQKFILVNFSKEWDYWEQPADGRAFIFLFLKAAWHPWREDVNAESRLMGLNRREPFAPDLYTPSESKGLIPPGRESSAVHRIGPPSKWGIHPELSRKYIEKAANPIPKANSSLILINSWIFL